MRALTGTESEAPRYFLASFNPVHLQDALWAFLSGIAEQFNAYVLVLVIVGGVAAWKKNWRTALFLCTSACTVALLFSVTYPNEADVGRYRLMAVWLAVPHGIGRERNGCRHDRAIGENPACWCSSPPAP